MRENGTLLTKSREPGGGLHLAMVLAGVAATGRKVRSGGSCKDRHDQRKAEQHGY